MTSIYPLMAILILAIYTLPIALAGQYIIVLSRAHLAGLKAARDPMNRLTLLDPWEFFNQHYYRERFKMRFEFLYQFGGALYLFLLPFALIMAITGKAELNALFALIFPLHCYFAVKVCCSMLAPWCDSVWFLAAATAVAALFMASVIILLGLLLPIPAGLKPIACLIIDFILFVVFDKWRQRGDWWFRFEK
jgi:hypothetical protein